jgi:NAD(P)-dependent dehydrogenase (short-subunit alcohol dehydrogenase family)
LERRLEGKVAVITGASSGIGAAAAVRFAGEGASVVLAARRVDEGEAVTRRITDAGGTASFIQADVSRWEQVEAMVEYALKEYGALHYAFNNAGKSARGTDRWLDVTEESWDEMIDINLKGVWMCMRREIPAIIESGGGAIVNNSSVIGVRASGSAPYSASKSGVIGLTKSAAIQFAGRGVRVNAVAPGWIMTPILENRMSDNPDLLSNVRSSLAFGREGEAEEVAAVAAWLCSDESSYVTGECVSVDGGLLAQLGPLR